MHLRNIILPLLIAAAAPTVCQNVDTTKTSQPAKTLKAVTIAAKRPVYTIDGEKNIYNVADDPAVQSGTTEDALQNTPGVSVDVEGNITLRGVSSIEIWIDDKPSRLSAENLKTWLQTLPASAIDHIETITNPPAKYNTEAEAVINIVTSAHIKKNQFLSFGLNGATQPYFSPWLSYTWANDKLSFNIFGSYRNSNTHSEEWNRSTTYGDSPTAPGNLDSLQRIICDTGNYHNNSHSGSGTLYMSINYTIDSTSDINFWSNLNLNTYDVENISWRQREHILPSPALYVYDQRQTQHFNTLYGFFGGHYSKRFDKKGHNLNISLYGNLNKTNQQIVYDRIYSITDNQGNNSNSHKFKSVDQFTPTFSLRLRYSRPYSEQGEFTYGLSVYHSSAYSNLQPYVLDSPYDEQTTVLSPALYDTLRRYVFTANNPSPSADVEWHHRWGEFSLQIGMGVRLSPYKYAFSETITLPGVDTSFLNVTFNPSIHLTYRTANMHNFKLNYTMRMGNPPSDALSEFPIYGEDSYRIGNHNISQSFTHNAEAGWSKYMSKGNISAELYGKLSSGEVEWLTDITDSIDPYIGRVITFQTPYNLGSSYRYGLSTNGTWRPTAFFNLRFYANIYHYGYSVHYDRLGLEPYSDDKWQYSMSLNLWAKILGRYQVNASASYTSPTIGLLSTGGAQYRLNGGIRADFFKRKLSVFVNIQDIFNWGKRIGNAKNNTNPYFVEESVLHTLNSRYISAGLTLRFGKMELENKTKSGSE
ncbi:MAG: outer membrane beta-barrel protein [Bacteroidales bacterium]|nr:outer membrane beta-barrel protein [Bacteroidales bacterium]